MVILVGPTDALWIKAMRDVVQEFLTEDDGDDTLSRYELQSTPRQEDRDVPKAEE